MLIDLGGLRVLNQNDAGLNRRIAGRLPPVDVLTCQFSHGASGFPATWGHLTDEEKSDYYRRAGRGALSMLEQAMELYGARYLLPFASHFALWHPSHQGYARRLGLNTLDDVRRLAAASGWTVLDLLPGESWNSATQRFVRAGSRASGKRLATRSDAAEYVRETFNDEVFRRFHPVEGSVTRDQVRQYLLGLNRVPEIRFCEDVRVRLSVLREYEGSALFDVRFRVQAGHLEVPDTGDTDRADLEMWVPAPILALLISEELSWDEAHIGYWCRFDRDPDVYHPGFWRLLHCPYYRREPRQPWPGAGSSAITARTAISELTESHPEAERILGQHGLYCLACGKGYRETLADGARAHGLSQPELDRLVTALNQAIP